MAVVGIGALTFTRSIAALEEFQEEAVAEARSIEELKDLLFRADDVGESYAETRDPAVGREFKLIGGQIDLVFERWAALNTGPQSEPATRARSLWIQSRAAVLEAKLSGITDPKVMDDRMDPYHDDLDEAVTQLGRANTLNVNEIATEISFLGRLERFQLFAALGILVIASFVAALLAAKVRRSITTPLLNLEAAASQFGSDNLSHRIEVMGDDELARVGSALNTMAGKLERSTAALTQSEQQRSDLLGKVLDTGEKERTRLAGELHDGPVQGLTQLMYELELSTMDAEEAQRTDLSRDLNMLQGRLSNQIETLRTMMIDLRPPVLDERGLQGAIQAHLDTWAPKLPPADLYVDLPRRLETTLETVLFRGAQEALINVAKHASASKVSIRLTEEDGVVVLTVRDDGVGFASLDSVAGHIGLDAMKERVESAGGAVVVDSNQGSGTTVGIRFEQKEMMPV
ncbi:MAG TPA: sensor histidine kinase [Actinomycetota bacterium]|nr:sensor histidine kinase [Actinomycetota bacterium]